MGGDGPQHTLDFGFGAFHDRAFHETTHRPHHGCRRRARRCCFLFGCSLRSSVFSSGALPSRHRHSIVRFQRLTGCERVHLRGWLQHATHCQCWSGGRGSMASIVVDCCGRLASGTCAVLRLSWLRWLRSAPAQHVLLDGLSTVTATAIATSCLAPLLAWFSRRERAPDLRPLQACRFWLHSRSQHISPRLRCVRCPSRLRATALRLLRFNGVAGKRTVKLRFGLRRPAASSAAAPRLPGAHHRASCLVPQHETPSASSSTDSAP